MPKKTKLLRAGRLSGRRRIYVSWKDDSPDKQRWKTDFFERVQTDTEARDESFALPLETGHKLPGDLIDNALEAEGDPITDVVGVMTTSYVGENVRKSGDSPGELARAINKIVKADKRDRVRVWLAPVDKFLWKAYRVSDVVLADPEGVHRAWLIRLKGDNERFIWPTEKPAESSDEIVKAVATIIDELETK